LIIVIGKPFTVTVVFFTEKILVGYFFKVKNFLETKNYLGLAIREKKLNSKMISWRKILLI